MQRLAADERLPLDADVIGALMADPAAVVGAAGDQVRVIAGQVDDVAARYPHAAGYVPEPIV